jgi:transcriptional regulator GlxA family with amidase domain
MGLINWIFDFYQHGKINRAQEDANLLRYELQSLRSGQSGVLDTARLERAIGELALAVKTVQQIAVEKGLCSEEEFRQRLREIDARDGLQDGRSPF